MATFAEKEIKDNYTGIKLIRRTVPGIKDLPVECKILLKECDIVMAFGMPGREDIDRQCAHEASQGIIMAQLMEDKHIIEVFVHENEATNERELFEICKNRAQKHAHNAVDLVLYPEKLAKRAATGRRQGKDDVGSIPIITSR